MVTQVVRNQYNEIQVGNFCQFGVRKKINTGGGEIPSNEMHFTTTSGALSYLGNSGDVITFSDGTTYTVLEDGGFSSENVPTGKHKVKLVTERSDGYVGIDGEALIELNNFPSLGGITQFDFCPNTGSPNLVKVPTTLPSNITNISYMFNRALSFNQDISMWDTSKVTDMSEMLSQTSSFNQSLNTWDVSKVTSMKGMFRLSESFNQPLANWNTSKVINMHSMFNDSGNFNQDISSWNVSNVVEMDWMFANASAFNQDLSQWCVSLIVEKPSYFNYGDSALTPEHLPVWGTCPA